MKTRRTKVLLSLLAVMAAGFAVTNAYTFQVQNRNPFGVLNLSKLIIKPDTSTESMELSGYTLKIMTTNGKLYVHQICDENGENCSNAADIGGGNGSGITATGIAGDFCKLKSDGNLECNDDLLAEIDAIQTAIAALPSPKDGTLTIKQGNNTRYFSANTGTDVEITLANGGPGNYTAGNGISISNNIISSVPNTNKTDGHVTAGEGHANMVRKTNEAGEPAWRKDEVSEGGGDRQLNTKDQAGYVATGGEDLKGKVRKVDDDGNPKWLNDATSEGGGDWQLNTKDQAGYVATGEGQKNMVRKTDADGNPGWREDAIGGGGDSEWLKDSITQLGFDGVTMGILHPKQQAYNVWIGVNIDSLKGGSAQNYKLRVNGKTQLDGITQIKPNSSVPAIFDNYGVRFFNAMSLIMTRYNATFNSVGQLVSKVAIGTATGFTVNGPIAAGNPNNYIYIYASTGDDDSDRHYEIMGRNELAVGTQYGAFIYFTQKTGSYVYHIEPLMYGNTTEQGGQVSCPAPTPQVPNPKCTSPSSMQGGDLHVLNQNDYVAAYQTFMVGVNTNQPNATLDVFGSLRIGNNCVPATCDQSHAGTMMYYETSAYGGVIAVCALSSSDGNYHRNALKMNEFEEYGSPKSYAQSCYAPAPTPHPIPHPEPYEVLEGVATPVQLSY